MALDPLTKAERMIIDVGKGDPPMLALRSFDSLFNPIASRWSLPLDHVPVPLYLEDKDDHLELTADMPGIAKEDLTVTLRDRWLSIRGKRGNIEYAAGCQIRTQIDPASSTADLRNGVLIVKLTKAPSARNVNIKVN